MLTNLVYNGLEININTNFLYQLFDVSVFFFILFTLGAYGILTNRRNVIIILLFLEIMMLASSLNFLHFCSVLDLALGQVFAIYILTIAGSEVSIGLAFVILLFRCKGLLNLSFFLSLKG